MPFLPVPSLIGSLLSGHSYPPQPTFSTGYKSLYKYSGVGLDQIPKARRTSILGETSGKLLVFDVAMDITHEFPSKVTQYPVEDRSTVAEHIVNENLKFTVTGIFSDATNYSGKPSKTQAEFYSDLITFRDNRETVSLITPLDAFTTLIITSISLPRTAENGRAITFTLNFEQIRKVKTSTATVFVNVSAPTEDKADGNTDGGSQSGKEVEDEGLAHSISESIKKALSTDDTGSLLKDIANAKKAAGQ